MEIEEIRSYDLTNSIILNLDRHMVPPLLEFLTDKKLHPESDLLVAKLKLINKTNMVDFAISLHQQLTQTENIPPEMSNKRQAVIDRLQILMEDARDILDIFRNPQILGELREDKQFNIKYLTENHGFKLEMLESLYRYAKFQFECGDYTSASEMLYQFRTLSTNPEKNMSALWGKFASEILVNNFDTAAEDLNSLKSSLEQMQGQSSHLELLRQRTWLIHWGLFIFFNHEKGRDMILELLLQPSFKQAIQTTCPHILRYLTAAVILKRRKKDSLKEVLSLIQQENYQYRDPLTQFLEALFVHYDFDEAQRTLPRCAKVMEYDFFLEAFIPEFMENARLFIFETYCKIHQRIDIESLSQKLNMDRSEAEVWIVDLIRTAHLEAKIDSENNAVTLTQKTHNVFQQVIERTKPLTYRTGLLFSAIDRPAQIQAAKPNKGSGGTSGGPNPGRGGPNPGRGGINSGRGGKGPGSNWAQRGPSRFGQNKEIQQ